MAKNFNLLIFSILTIGLLAISWIVTGSLSPSSGPEMIWFNSGLFMLLVARFIIEYRFSKPSDVFLNSLAVFVSVSALTNPPNAEWWNALRWGALSLGIASLVLAWDQRRSPEDESSPWRKAAYSVVVSLGQGTVLFSIVFLLALLSYFDLEEPQTKILAITWGAILVVANLRLDRIIQHLSSKSDKEVLGYVTSFTSPRTLYFERADGISLRDHTIVGISSKSDGAILPALIHGERRTPGKTIYVANLLRGTLREGDLDGSAKVKRLPSDDPQIHDLSFVEAQRTVGLVCEGSSVSTLSFDIMRESSLTTGSLLEAQHQQGKIYYQLFDGMILEERSINSNERLFIRANAEQIGRWDVEANGFKTFGWLAEEDSPVLLVGEESEAERSKLASSETEIGRIPQSKFPAVIDLHDLILFHSAVLGVTGSGKSFLTFEIVESCAHQNVKVVCIDPTGDYQRYLPDAVLIKSHGALRSFLDSERHGIGILETAINQKDPIIQCHDAAAICLDWCKKNRKDEEIIKPSPKVLFVLEEAHLLIPEWNFNPTRNLQDKVNQTSQIVLQARKYGLGFLIVAQRTANVLKSALNQCNTIIALQQFDQTGFDFLSNYMGRHHVQSLPNLAERHGIVVGKASASQRPVLVRFNDQTRKLNAKVIPDMPEGGKLDGQPKAAPEAPRIVPPDELRG
ncbi:ATP-binding protein [Erythrobacter sp. GH1-10]|uniref:ATP-binding protein n=1 Tax=Erythrobacter sp. GH1-10 TaxID=3349334 RepID=UPI003877A742